VIKTCIQEHTEGEVGVIVMEDFHDRGENPDFVQGLNVTQLERVLAALAAVHAKSLEIDDWQSLLATMTRSRFETAAGQSTTFLMIIIAMLIQNDLHTQSSFCSNSSKTDSKDSIGLSAFLPLTFSTTQ
jgi:hypothetical protein